MNSQISENGRGSPKGGGCGRGMCRTLLVAVVTKNAF